MCLQTQTVIILNVTGSKEMEIRSIRAFRQIEHIQLISRELLCLCPAVENYLSGRKSDDGFSRSDG